ncbi:MAG: hypothetical protein KDI09_21370, partial [Halioglobus sp.]|nr:hypothetical protein [Halioglobus sp.]
MHLPEIGGRAVALLLLLALCLLAGLVGRSVWLTPRPDRAPMRVRKPPAKPQFMYTPPLCAPVAQLD